MNYISNLVGSAALTMTLSSFAVMNLDGYSERGRDKTACEFQGKEYLEAFKNWKEESDMIVKFLEEKASEVGDYRIPLITNFTLVNTAIDKRLNLLIEDDDTEKLKKLRNDLSQICEFIAKSEKQDELKFVWDNSFVATQSVLNVVFEPRKTSQDVLDCVKNFINDIDCYIRRL